MSVTLYTREGLVIDGEPLIPHLKGHPPMLSPVDPFLTEADLQAADANQLLGIINVRADALADSLDIARNVQWTAARPTPSEDGQPSNPTADTTADPDRLALRLQVIASERALRETASRLQSLYADLEGALAPYGGDRIVD